MKTPSTSLAKRPIPRRRRGLSVAAAEDHLEAGELLYNAAIDEIGTRYDTFLGAA